MDYVTRQFIVLAKKLRKDLREALQEQTKAISDATKAAHENEQQPLPVPLPVVAELQVPEAEKTERRKQHKKSHTLQILLTIGTWLAFIAASVYAAITAIQLGEMRKATKTADETLKAVAKQFRFEQRARIGVPFFNIGPPSVKEIAPGVELHGNVQFVNFGRAPAVFDDGGIVFEVRSTPVPDDAQYPPRPNKSRLVIYPGQNPAPTSNDALCTLSEEQFKAAKKGVEMKLVLHGIVRYHDDFGSYTTKYCFFWTGDDRFFSPCYEHNTVE